MKTSIRMNDWINDNIDQTTDFRVSYQEIDYNIDSPLNMHLLQHTRQNLQSRQRRIPCNSLQEVSKRITKYFLSWKILNSVILGIWKVNHMHAYKTFLRSLTLFISLYHPLINSFSMNKKIMYVIFAEVLLTDKVKSLVRHYELYWDVQKIHMDLLVHTETSTNASVDSDHLLTYITIANLSDGLWGGYTDVFILHR